MTRIIYKLVFCLSVLFYASCASEHIEQELTGKGAITLELYTGTGTSRATVEDEAHEYALSHLDVFIFKNDDANSIFHYERIDNTDAPTGTVTLSKDKGYFEKDASYWVYVIANSSATEESMKSISTLDDLKAITQEDTNIHLSGLELADVPRYFLMDGIAYMGGTEPETAGALEINDGSAAGTTVLKVNLRRAAAKVEIILTAGDAVEFFRNNEVGYYLRNMPTVTTMLADATLGTNAQKLVTTAKTVSDYSNGKYKNVTENYNEDGELSIVAYVYAHSWTVDDFLTKGTSLIVNIPLKYNGQSYNQSYYQIELRKDRKFERNHYYKITGTINAPGAEEYTEPITLTDMMYSAIDWTSVDVNVGGEEKPHYLKVNKDILRIYNQSVDESLIFASSSPITITVKQTPYYYNKYAVQNNVSNEIVSQMNAASSVKDALSGNIKVNSPVPVNKTIRYFTLVIENEDGDEVEVQVEQYPVIYVTNQLGWYSYRSDFGTSYKNKGNRYVSISLSGSGNGYNWKWDGGYDYSTSAESGFWYSKVEITGNQSGSNLNIEAYYWPSNSQSNTATIESADPSGNNARIYQITVTATSNEYTIGRPRMKTVDGVTYTDPSDDNAKLVSPSFMIASRLGVIISSGGNLNRVSDEDRLTIFRHHCANYVEVVKGTNGAADIVYDDWRLPTEAELKIIMDYQGTSGQDADAIDYLLNGKYYFGAAGPVYNTKYNSDGTTVRCVRDAY